MTRTPKNLLIAAVLAATGAFAVAQAPAPAAPAAGEASSVQQRGRMDPAQFQQRMEQRQQRMQERRTQRMADLKAQLKITPAQEGAWTAYTAAMQPPAKGPRMDRAEFDKLTTPQRIDRMEQFAAERQAQMKQRGDAVKAFYAQLTPEQQKLYDDRAMRGGKGKRGGPGHHGMGWR